VTGRQGRRRKKLLDGLKERRGYSHLKEEALDRTVWRARFGRGFGPVVRETPKKSMTSLGRGLPENMKRLGFLGIVFPRHVVAHEQTLT